MNFLLTHYYWSKTAFAWYPLQPLWPMQSPDCGSSFKMYTSLCPIIGVLFPLLINVKQHKENIKHPSITPSCSQWSNQDYPLFSSFPWNLFWFNFSFQTNPNTSSVPCPWVHLFKSNTRMHSLSWTGGWGLFAFLPLLPWHSYSPDLCDALCRKEVKRCHHFL